MAPPAEPLRRLPVPARLIARETIGSFLTRLAFANSLRIPHLLALAAISTDTRSFSPATDDTRGWAESTPDRIAALAGRPLPELAAAIPLLATMKPADTVPLRACGHCTAAKNVTGMVIIRARARDYLCLRHQQWLRGIHRPSLAALPEVTGSQRRHDTRTGNIPDEDIARAHQQARDITGQWLATGWHPALTERWHDRHRRLTAARPGLREILTDVIIHPEMLAIACLLLGSQHAPVRPGQITGSLGFDYPSRPHPRDPLQLYLADEQLLRSALNRYRGGPLAAHAGNMGEDLGFGGEAAGFYHQYRRGYPSAVVNTLIGAFALTSDDVVIDLGCGTGQLTLPIAGQVHAVAGVDPEPDMLARARQAAAEQGVRNANWVLGADTDIPALAALLGNRRAGAVTIGQALHWMRYRELIPALVPLLRPGGGIAVITNGTPMWLQDSHWSQALRSFLEQWLGTTLTDTCGTDDASQQRYRDTMTEAGLDVTETSHDYTDELDLDHLVGSLYSAIPAQRLPPPDQRTAFAGQIRRAVAPHAPFTEPVPVRMLLGRRPQP
jgi:ubiquinone/menaquinone biosynthesis C-methylase UbiE